MIKERRYGWGCTAFLSVFHKSSLHGTCDGMLPLIPVRRYALFRLDNGDIIPVA